MEGKMFHTFDAAVENALSPCRVFFVLIEESTKTIPSLDRRL